MSDALQAFWGAIRNRMIPRHKTDRPVPPPADIASGGRAANVPAGEQRDKSSRRVPPTGRILVVEDQADVRSMLATALELDGHEVDQASHAIEGLQRLQSGSYDLVISDFAMPGATGAWMLHEATRLGLLTGTAALIVTAHAEVNDLGNVEVIAKPLDLDAFLDQVRRIVTVSPERKGRGSPRRARGSHRVELALYVSSASPASLQARRNLERILSGFEQSQVKFSIHDLVHEPLAGEDDRVTFTPTLVKRNPEPRMWILGNLREPDIVADLLRVCGVDASPAGTGEMSSGR